MKCSGESKLPASPKAIKVVPTRPSSHPHSNDGSCLPVFRSNLALNSHPELSTPNVSDTLIFRVFLSMSGAGEDDLRTFYSCLYRTFLFPRKLHELRPCDVGNCGSACSVLEPFHYSPYNGRVCKGVLYADNGFWDTHRTVYPLFSIVCPELLGEMIEGYAKMD